MPADEFLLRISWGISPDRRDDEIAPANILVSVLKRLLDPPGIENHQLNVQSPFGPGSVGLGIILLASYLHLV